MAVEIVITRPNNEESLDKQYEYYNRLPNDIKIRSDSIAQAATGKTNTELYAMYKSQYIKNDNTSVNICDPEVENDTDSSSIQEIDLSYNPNIKKEQAIANGGYTDADGVWNSILTFPDDKNHLYRGRVECLILKDDCIYLNIKSNGSYRIPGGSFNYNTPNEVQAKNEVMEEAKIVVENVKYTGIAYKETFNTPPHWAVEKNMPVLWNAKYTEVYIGTYKSTYTGFIADIDKDDDMYLNGKFYPIKEVYNLLSTEHRKALKNYETIVKEEANAEYVSDDPTKDFTDEMYKIAKQWSDENGFIIISQKNDLDELDRQYQKFLSMPEFAKDTSNRKSIQIFGVNNITHYKYLRHNLLKRDTTDIQVQSIASDDKLDSHTIMDDNVQESTRKLINAIRESTSIIDRNELIEELSDITPSSFAEEVVVNNFLGKISEIDDFPELTPFFSPEDMDSLGVFDDIPEGNFYNVESTKESYDWYKLYKSTKNPGDNWFSIAKNIYGEYLIDSSLKNKQRLLEIGWNPEIPFSLSSVSKRSKDIRKSLIEHSIQVEDTSSFKDINDYIEMPYIYKNIKLYNLAEYLKEDIDINKTIGKIFVDESNNYICHVSKYDGRVVGFGYAIGKKKLVEQIL